MTAPWLRVPNFEGLRHYQTSRLWSPWIKVHDRWLEDYRFAKLPDREKLAVLLIWLLANRCGNLIPNDSEWVTFRLAMDAPVDLDVLVAKGFLEPAPAHAEAEAPARSEDPGRPRAARPPRPRRKARPAAPEAPPSLGDPDGGGSDPEPPIPATTPARAAELLDRFRRREPL